MRLRFRRRPCGGKGLEQHDDILAVEVTWQHRPLGLIWVERSLAGEYDRALIIIAIFPDGPEARIVWIGRIAQGPTIGGERIGGDGRQVARQQHIERRWKFTIVLACVPADRK